MNNLYGFIVFWGAWILVPMLADGITVISGLLGAFFYYFSWRRQKWLKEYPQVSIIIPVYNCGQTLEACIRSIARQSYPNDKMEVIVVNNGSRDDSEQVFERLREKNLYLNMSWHSIVGKGKSYALNSGIHMASGEYIINIDCDLTLEQNAIRNAIVYLENNKDVGAATGYLVIRPPDESASVGDKLLARLEFLEYATVFGVGRSYQTFMESVYTLSGAFSMFRREALLKTYLYSQDTVSEDTDLTFHLYEKAPEYRIVSIPKAIAYLFPIESWEKLYSQRVRWQRGQLEVSALHHKNMNLDLFKFKGVSMARALIIDHTLSLPRLVWTAFMPILAGFGYPLSLITASYLVMYGLYFGIELLWMTAAWQYADRRTRKRILESWYYLPLMPIYRLVVFVFRVAGFINVIAEPSSWNVGNPIDQIRDGIKDTRQNISGAINKLTKG